MTTYSTGNPIGSPDPRDLYDNAENLDNAANSDNATWTDRLGQSRRTMAGIEQDAIAAIQNAGYVGTGTDNAIEDYAAGIEITQYNQIVRDGGEFWRVSGSETLPYTLTGAGVPEGGALVSVGDAALRQDLVQPVATFNNVADMKDASGLDVGRKVRTLGYYEPGDGGGNDYEIVADGTGSNYGFLFEQLTASGHEAKLLGGGIIEDKTTYIPTDYATLQDAIDDLSKLRVSQGVTIDLMIEEGHKVESGVIVEYGEYSHFVIKSQDSIASVSTSFSGDFVRASYSATAPTLGCLIDGGGLVGIGYGLYANSRGFILQGCGVNNYTSHGLWIYQGSTCGAKESVFEGGAGPAVRVSRGSVLHAGASSFINNVSSSYVIYVNRESMASLQGVNCDGATAPVVFFASRGGYIDAHRLPSQTCTNDFIKMQRLSSIYTGGASSETITVGGSAIIALSLSSVGVDSSLNFVSSNGQSDGIDCQQGSSVSFLESSLSGFNRGLLIMRGGRVNCSGSQILNTVDTAISMRGDFLDANNCQIDGADVGMVVFGSRVDVYSASFNNITNTVITGVDGSYINAKGVTVNGNPLEISDTTFSSFGFADNEGRGFIWN